MQLGDAIIIAQFVMLLVKLLSPALKTFITTDRCFLPRKKWTFAYPQDYLGVTRIKPNYTFDLLLVRQLEIQNCYATKIESGCTCSQLCQMSATCRKKFNSVITLELCLSIFVAEPTVDHTCDILVSESV